MDRLRRSRCSHRGRCPDRVSSSPPVDRLLVLHAGALGDCVLALHLAAAVRFALGVKHLTVAARSPIIRWAERQGLIDAAFLLDDLAAYRWYAPDCLHTSHVGVDCLPPSQGGTKGGQSRDPFLSRFDVIVSLLGGPDDPITGILRELSGAPVLAVDPRPAAHDPEARVHIVRQWAARLGAGATGSWLPVDSGCPIAFEIPDTGAAFLHRTSAGRAPLTIVHPGSGSRSKCCPLDLLEDVVRGIAADGSPVAWMIGPDEVERDGRELIAQLERLAPVLFLDSIEEAADAVAAAGALIGNDTGMTHVAALAGIHTLALFGPTDPAVWRPLGPSCATLPFDRTAVQAWCKAVLGACKGASQKNLVFSFDTPPRGGRIFA